MYICICKAVTDSEIRAEVQRGYTSFSCIQERLGVAQQCGKCIDATHNVIQKTAGKFDTQGLIKDTAC